MEVFNSNLTKNSLTLEEQINLITKDELKEENIKKL
jgi:hypothetical protein